MKTHECRNECDRDRIHDFLNGDADQPDSVLTEQLEECAACRAYFDSHVASDDEWSQVGQLLQPSEHDRATRIVFSAGSNAGRQARQSVSITDVLESLAPTDDPHSLGRIGKYEVNGVFGAGGMGVVLKAFEPSLDRVVAIKVLAPHLANNEKARRRFEREARAAAAVINPNVIPIYSVANDGKLPYLVMACIQGGSLQQRLDAQGAASVPEVLRIGSQIASGLAAAHEQGLVHRDIKPENILFEGDVERVSITDFGLARAVDDNSVTQAGTIAGTPMYMSPEQARGEQVDQQSDLFSLGSVLYALCTGQPPYYADSSLGVMRKITDEAPAPIRELNSETPEWLATIIERLMERDKAKRFAAAAEVHDVLEACLSHVQEPTANPLPASLRMNSRSTRRGLRTKLGMVAVVVFSLLCASGLFIALSLPGNNSNQAGNKLNDRVFKPLSAIDGYIHTMLVATKDPDSTFLSVGQLGESGRSLTIFPEKGGVTIEYMVPDRALRPSQQGMFVDRLREVAETLSVPVTERSEISKDGDVKGVVLTLAITGEPQKLTETINQLVTQVFGVNRTSVCRFDFHNVPVRSVKIDGPEPRLVSRTEFMAALDSGYLYAAEARNTIYIGPAEATAQKSVPWDDSIYYIRVNDLQEDELGVARLGKTQFAALQNPNQNVAVAADNNPPATLANLSDADLALVYKQITGAELAEGFISGSDLASSVNILLGYDNISREKIAENLVKLGKPEVAKVVLSSGRVDSAATAFKMGDMLVASGDGANAVDAYLNALRIAPRLFNEKYIKPFDEQNRLKELAELFTEDRIRKTQLESVTPMSRLLERLMQDDMRASVGMAFMDRLWKARPDMRAWVFDETRWDEVPNRADYFADVLIPKNVEKVGNGWGAMYGDVQGGWVSEVQEVLDKRTTRELIDRIRPKVEDHKNWLAGAAMLAVLESLNGNCEPAKRLLADKENTAGMKWYQKGYLGLSLQGKDRELDEQIIRLYEASLEQRSSKSPYRSSRVHDLAKLYHKFGRKQDALDLMYGLVERERKVEEFLFENWGNPKTVNLDHERIWDLRTAVETLNSIGYPMDSLLLLSRVTFEQRRAAGVYKGGGWEYNDKHVDESTSKSQKLLNANSIVEAINRGVIPVGLASKLDKKSGEIENPIVKILAQVARKELSNEVAAAFESVNTKLADPDAMDQHLSDLMKQHPADTDIAVAATLFAFFQNDIDKAQKRLAHLVSVVEANPKVSAADVGLHLVAEIAATYEETFENGEKLAKRAKQAGQQSKPWKQFFEHRNEDDYAEQGAKKLIVSAERLEARGDIDGAIDVYLKAFRLNPGSFDWNKIHFFKEAGRLAEVADCFDVAAIRSPLNSLSPITTYSSLIEALMADPATRKQGLRLFRDCYASRIPGSRSFPFGTNNGFGIDWKTIPDPIFYFRNKFLPIDFDKAGDGWELFGKLTEKRYGAETQDGWFSESRSLFVHRDAMRQFTDELREAAAQHKSWKVGFGYLAAFETELGNYEAAARLLNENVMGPSAPNLPAGAAWALGLAVEGKSEELDRIAIQLFEHALPQIAKPRSVEQYRKPLRLSPVFRLARLYRKYDQNEDARQLLQAVVRTDNQHPLVEGYVPGVSGYCHNAGSCIECHRSERNFYGIATYSKVMTEFGYPVDSLLSLARIDESFSVNKEWQHKSLYKDFQKQQSNAAQTVTPRVVIKALQDGSFASAAQLDRRPFFYARRGDIDNAEKENRLLLDLKPEQVRPSVIGLRLAVRGPKTRSAVFSPVIDILNLAADFDGEDAEADKDRLDDLLRLQAETNPGDVQAAVASTAFAFLRNDLATAKSRLEALQGMKLSEDAEDQEANASLWLVARYALNHDSTRSLGEALATKALKAAKSLPAKDIEHAIVRERADIAAANAPKTMLQRIKMDLNPAELRQLTDELLEIYRNGPGGLPRKQIGGDRLVFNAFKKAGRLVELGECIGETAELLEECDLVTARETIEALMKDDQTRSLAYQTLEKAFKVSHEVRSQVLAYPENFGVDWKTAPNAIIYLRASLLPARLNRYQHPFSKSLFGNKKTVREFTDEVRLLHAKARGAKAFVRGIVDRKS